MYPSHILGWNVCMIVSLFRHNAGLIGSFRPSFFSDCIFSDDKKIPINIHKKLSLKGVEVSSKFLAFQVLTVPGGSLFLVQGLHTASQHLIFLFFVILLALCAQDALHYQVNFPPEVGVALIVCKDLLLSVFIKFQV